MIKVDGLKYTQLWHCFGNVHHLASLETIINMLKESETNVLAINTHRLKEGHKEYLEIGYDGISLDSLTEKIDISKLHKMLNINLQTSAKLAYEKTKLAYDMSGERLIKLEVLGGDYKHSNQNEIVVAARDIIRWNSSLNVYPLLENDLLTAKKLIDVGCKLLRVMGSGIGTGEGIKDIKTLAKICELGVPVIIDGGIGSLDDAKQALEVGVDGILVNSMLFEQIEPPEVVLKDFKNLFK